MIQDASLESGAGSGGNDSVAQAPRLVTTRTRISMTNMLVVSLLRPPPPPPPQ